LSDRVWEWGRYKGMEPNAGRCILISGTGPFWGAVLLATISEECL
jgi:hypothetical protein